MASVPRTLQTQTNLIEFADDALFRQIIADPNHIAYLLPDKTDVHYDFRPLDVGSGVTPIGQGWTNARGLRGLGGPKTDPNFFF